MDVYNELALQYDIDFNGIIIHQYTLDDIFHYGLEKYNNLLLPYCITSDMLSISEEDKLEYNIFSDVIMKEANLLTCLVISLKFFCKCNCIWVYDDFIKVRNGILNKDNFEEFSNIILKIHAREKPKVEKLPDNPKQRELELKLRSLRARHKSKSEFQLCDVINNVKYGGKYYISTVEIKKMTLWELYNAFNAKLGVDKSDSSLSIALVAGDKNNTLEDNHWSKLLKIGK